MLLGRTSSTATAITAGTTAYQHNNILSGRNFTNYIYLWCSCNNSTNLHALSQEALMIYLGNLTSSQANLITIGAIACCCPQSNLLLWQLALQGFANRTAWICCTGNTHSLIYIGTARQWIADSTAQTGSSATKWLNLSRMVMGFVLEHNQPFLIFATNICINHNTASVDFLGLVQILQLALLPQCLHANNSQIHQGNITILASIEILSICQILIISLADRFCIIAILNIHQIYSCGKGSMTAMV